MARTRRSKSGGAKRAVKATVRRPRAAAPRTSAGGDLLKAVQGLVKALPVGELEKRLAGLEKSVEKLDGELRKAVSQVAAKVRGTVKRAPAKRAVKRRTVKRTAVKRAPAAKRTVKRTAAKRIVKRTAAKRTAVKRTAVKRTAVKRAPAAKRARRPSGHRRPSGPRQPSAPSSAPSSG